ncbi:MAG: glycogen synthase GlgA [Pseudomonadota bacterium]
MIKVLSVASECVPFIKTGGLADVAGALPAALSEQGVDMRVLLPGYPAVLAALGASHTVLEDGALFGGPAQLLAGEAEGIKLYVLEAEHLYERSGTPYLGPEGRDWADNPQRFAALSWVAARLGAEGAEDWRPDLVHAHDWQGAFAPYYLKRHFDSAVPSVLTIHNVAFHGMASAALLTDLRLDPADFTPEGFEFYGSINALKAGILFADKITTVSPTYSKELTRPEFGAGLDGVIRARGTDLSGILNGIDTNAWDPAHDDALAEHYASYRHVKKKQANTEALRAEFGLPPADGPLCVVVSRLTEQKGLDLLLEALPALIENGGQLALLGSGDAALELAYREAAATEPNVAVYIGYNEAVSHRVIAGGDAIIVPSRFEPCGLTQLYGLRYGTIPLVALTGGLADTVIPASPAALSAGVATGIQVFPLTADALRQSLIDLCALFRRPDDWAALRRNAMDQAVGWERSAAAYTHLYGELVPS